MTMQTTGAAALWAALEAAGVEMCFANPGTTELDLVRALEGREGMRCVLGLQENVCTGAADGYGRMRGQAAATLLHLGPGFANGIANLHNARRARTPLVNIIGDQASWHLPFDAPLTLWRTIVLRARFNIHRARAHSENIRNICYFIVSSSQ